MLGLCSLAQNSLRALRALRSDNRAKSEVVGRWRARLQSPALLADAYGKRFGSLRIAHQADAQRGGWCCSSGPVGGVEERRTLARREAPSLTDFAQLSERSGPQGRVASSARAPKSEHRRAVRCKRTAEVGVPFFGSTFLGKQER